MDGQDRIHEECGVFGVYSRECINAAQLIYYGLTALQHRGQESAGIAVCDTCGPIGNICAHKDMGLVSEVFHKETLEKLRGNIGVGHVRYSTAGGSVKENAQPVFINYAKGTIALAHNGNIINIDEIRKALIDEGASFSGNADSEVIAYKIAEERMHTSSIEEAAENVSKLLKGGFALLILSPQKLLCIRDPWGLKPLCLGKVGDIYVCASESTALRAIGADHVRDVAPGEMVVITPEGVTSKQILFSETKAHCVFEYIYFARLDSKIDGISVYNARMEGGRALARRFPADADVVTGVPDSGLTAAAGYAEQSGIPFRVAFAKNSYVGRTFIKPTQEERTSSVMIKLRVIEDVVKGKKVILIDDSIVRGTTLANIIKEMKRFGAKEVHVRISSPPFLHPCYYGTDVPDNSQLIANGHTKEEIRRSIGADSLEYLDVSDLSEMTGGLPICRACFDGVYPVTADPGEKE
ncbi:MAG: amidophosphoribosyltransferase [Lachnospiraceae bacterium]|nr:amidophosphoribosyltransferase [Lachnospiraceae bacterium]